MLLWSLCDHFLSFIDRYAAQWRGRNFTGWVNNHSNSKSGGKTLTDCLLKQCGQKQKACHFVSSYLLSLQVFLPPPLQLLQTRYLRCKKDYEISWRSNRICFSLCFDSFWLCAAARGGSCRPCTGSAAGGESTTTTNNANMSPLGSSAFSRGA